MEGVTQDHAVKANQSFAHCNLSKLFSVIPVAFWWSLKEVSQMLTASLRDHQGIFEDIVSSYANHSATA